MRRFPIAMAGLALLLSVQATYAAKPWLTSFEKARAEAKRQNLLLVIHFYADWCGPCREMERDVLSSSALTKGMKGRFIAVKVDTDRREDLVDRYNIEALPSDVILSPKGKILKSVSYCTSIATGEYYSDQNWSKVFINKPRTKIGCNNSHGRCNSCSDVWDRSPVFFSLGKSLNGWGFNNKSWTKQKGMKKELNKFLKFSQMDL